MADLKSYALTTVSRVSDFGNLGIASGSTEETILTNIINQLTEYIENYIGRRVKKTAYTQEEYNGDGSDILLLKNWPIDTSLTFTLEVRTSGENEDDWDTEDSDQYFIYDVEGYIKFISGRKFLSGPKKYRVTYTAGYDFDNADTFLSDTQAGDLEYVAMKLALTAYERRKQGAGVVSEKIGDYAVSFAKSVFEDPEIRSILDSYKRIEIASHETPRHY